MLKYLILFKFNANCHVQMSFLRSEATAIKLEFCFHVKSDFLKKFWSIFSFRPSTNFNIAIAVKY
jgi:hypothetical protein